MQNIHDANDLETIQEGLNGLDKLEDVLRVKFHESQIVYQFYKSQLVVLEAQRVMLKRAAQLLHGAESGGVQVDAQDSKATTDV